MQCKICQKAFETLRALSTHIVRKHMPKEEYYCSFLKKNEKEGICYCGNKTIFLDLNLGYRKFCSQKCSANSEETRRKYKVSCIEKYGVENPNQSEAVNDKKQNTCLKKYGVECSFQSKEMQEKSKRTCLERYGTDNAFKSEIIRQKYRETCLKKYGVENVSNLPEIREKISQSNKNTVNDKNLQKALDLQVETGLRKKTQLFYVYAYLDPQKAGKFPYDDLGFLYEPFYIGKGLGKRYCDHLKTLSKLKNKHFRNKILKILESNVDIQNYIVILRDGLSEEEAFTLESQFIEEIGRKDTKRGPLTNLTNGGDGQRGISAETREKMRRAKLGKPLSEEHRRKISKANTGKKHSKETKRRIAEKHLGMKASMETKKKQSEAKKGKPGNRLGSITSEEVKKKMRQAKRGKTLPEGHKRKIAESVKNNWKIRKEITI